MGIKPFLSVVIPTYNEEKDIENCLKSLESQSFKNFEIIVVDDGSNDKTLEVINRFKKIKILKGEHKGPGFSRNLGAREAKGDILIFVDADMTFDKDYLKKLTHPIMNEESIGTENEIQRSSNYETNIWSRCWGKFFFDGSNKNRRIFRAIKKKKFFELGGFDPKYGYADDQTFYIKYGLKPDIAKGAICLHKGPSTLKEVYKQSSWIASSYDNKILKFPIIKLLIPILILLISPIAIIFSYTYKLIKNKDKMPIFKMFIFVIFRYFGAFNGISKKIYLKNNTR